MNTNQRAIELLELNDYDQSLLLFQQAVKESRDVQSLNNLAWIYSHEQGDDTTALELLKEAVCMNPSSYFPYNQLGEIYIKQENWQFAVDLLLKSIQIEPSIAAYNNLGVAKYHLGCKEEAADYFLRASTNSDYALYSHIKCLIDLGKTVEAKNKLDRFSEDADDFVGEIEIADFYVELQCFTQAINWFEKGWKKYWKQPVWVSRYVYALLTTNQKTAAQQVVDEVIQLKVKEINEAHEDEVDEDWTENDKEEFISKLNEDKQEYEHMIERISSGHFPLLKFDTSIQSGCYLFGCTRHNYPEYQE